MLWYHCVSVADLGGWGGPWPPRPLCKIILDTKAHYSPLIVSNTLVLPPFAVFMHAAASFLSPKAVFLRVQQVRELQKIVPRMH